MVKKTTKRTAYSQANRAGLLLSGPAYFDRMEALIDGAQRIVHLQVYIFANDPLGARIGAALVRAAQRGVTVFLLTDGYASASIAPELVKELRAAGGHFRWFEPLLRSRHFYIGRRMHHKVLVVDHRFSLVSGRNIAERYTDGEEPAWYDLAMEVEGEVALDLARFCCTVWNGTFRSERRERAVPPTAAEREALRDAWPANEHCAARMRHNDWLSRYTQITDSYTHMLREARSEVVLISSYFVPGRRLKNAIARATRRGVRITLINAGRSDVWIAKPAERWLYAWLLRHRVQVFEYDRTVLHAKAGVRDGVWCSLGSFNLNDLSTYTTVEVNVDVDDAGPAGALHAELQRVIAEECHPVTASQERRISPFTRLGRWLAYRTLSAMHGLLTFYYHQER